MNRIKSALGAILAAGIMWPAQAFEFTSGLWTVTVGDNDGKMTVSHNGEEIFKNVRPRAVYNIGGESESYTVPAEGVKPEVSTATADDCFGSGEQVVLVYAGEKGVNLRQTLTFYNHLPYFIAQATVVGKDGATVESNTIVPFETGEYSTPMGGNNNRILWVPFDNDGHGYYKCTKISATTLTGDEPSHEVGCVLNTDSRRGIVAGSVDHDKWKNGVTIAGRYLIRIEKFSCLSGLSNDMTRDAMPHGKVKGETVSSARFMIGVFDDWRDGMEAFADANATVVPPAKWDGGNPVGWSSYGSQQEYVNYEGVMESARFMKDELFDHGFHDAQGRITISLDAFGEDNIPAQRLRSMAQNAFGDGTTYNYNGETYDGMNMILGLYGGPFCVWDWTLDSKIPGTGLNGEPSYTYRDILLKVNGQPHRMPNSSALASDPTHPAVRAVCRSFLKNYSLRGAKYAKIDFMNCGIVQGDSYYNPEITTAVQAYNYGMQMVLEEAEKYGIYLVMAMSPAFPYQYSHGRRTCCDRFSELGESQYVMNATSYGWWFDRLYAVNDPDQMVLCKNSYNKQETEGENRVRATTGMTTGAFIFGDNFSMNCKDKNGNTVGFPDETKRRARIIMGNDDINAYVNSNTGSFRPVEGEAYFPATSQTSERMFYRHTPQYDYVAVFNFSKTAAQKGTVKWERLGVDPENVGAVKELWFGTEVETDGDGLPFDVPRGDVRVYRITNNDYSGIEVTVGDGEQGSETTTDIWLGADGGCNVISSAAMKSVTVYGIDGSMLGQGSAEGANEISLAVAGAPRLAVVKIDFADGSKECCKVFAR